METQDHVPCLDQLCIAIDIPVWIPPSAEGREEEKKCTLTHQRVDPDTGLHVCSFPPEDVYLFVEAQIKVTESGTNEPVYERVVNVENQVLLDPPTDVSVSLNGKPQQLKVRWTAPRPGNLQYEIQYSTDKAQACVICNWNSEEMEKDTQYTLYYQSRNGDWEVCDHSDVTNTCTFQGWNSSDIIVTVNTSSRHQNHTFYKEPINMNHMGEWQGGERKPAVYSAISFLMSVHFIDGTVQDTVQ
ncbi:Erythropoietin receptor [Acipenser ruthenus]|uniref:Erythropoietin receptor n=1 Tax=Acipenser ruthenus TaxID=7906 RepID=A0A444UZ25_ACIRT|nr:Erythropoietin receptor [Acipenser ruthenus]